MWLTQLSRGKMLQKQRRVRENGFPFCWELFDLWDSEFEGCTSDCSTSHTLHASCYLVRALFRSGMNQYRYWELHNIQKMCFYICNFRTDAGWIYRRAKQSRSIKTGEREGIVSSNDCINKNSRYRMPRFKPTEGREAVECFAWSWICYLKASRNFET